MNRSGKEPLQRTIEVRNWIVLGIFVILGFSVMSFEYALGIFLGGLISIMNFHWLYRDLKKTFQQISDKTKSSLLIKYYIRLAVTAVILFIVITRTPVSVIGLLLGLSVVIINIVITVVIESIKKNPVRRFKKEDASSVIS